MTSILARRPSAIPIAGNSLFSLLPDAAAARGLQSAARSSAATARQRLQDIETSGLASKARTARQEAQNLSRITGRHDRAVNVLEKAIDRLTEIKTNVADMRRQVVTAKDPSVDAEERRVFGDRFDQFLGKLNLRVKGAGFIGTNLIGTSVRDDFDPDVITYQTKPDSPVSKTVNGIYSQNEFFTTDASGDTFYPDIFGSTLTKFPNPDSENGETVNSNDTVAYDPDTGAISITKSGEGAPFLEGTVTRKGLEIGFSFLYNDFEDDANLDLALADVDAASSKIRFNIGFLEGELAKVKAIQSSVEGQIKTRNEFASGIEADAFGEQRRIALEARREELLFSATLQGTLGFNGQGGLLSLTSPSVFDFTV
jgi:hypothetical protein